MENQNQTPHKRRVRYKGKYPKKFEEKYKELQPEKYKDTIEHVIQKGNTPAGMHISIMVKEILDFLNIQPGETGFDATLGYGGHTKAMLQCLNGKGHIYATMKSQGASKNEANNAAQAAPAVKAEEKPAEKIDFSNVKIEPLFEENVDFDTFSKSDFRAVKIEACEAVPKSKKLLKFTLNDGTDRKRTILSGIHEYYEPEELVGKTAIAIVNLPPRKMMGIDSEGMLISAVHEEDGREGLHLLMVDEHIPAGAKLY